MIPIASFLAGAVSSFALSLVAAACLGPDEFGAYAIGLAIALGVNTLFFEWLRLSTIRFLSAGDRSAGDGRALAKWYGAAGLLVGAVALAASFSGLAMAGLGGPTVAAAIGAGLALGLFDREAALARAEGDDRRYGRLAVGRAVAVFAFAGSAAATVGTATAVLIAAAAGSGVFVVPRLLRLRPRSRPVGTGNGEHPLARFARYALPLVAAATIYTLLPFLTRTVLAERSGLAEAGFFALASEITLRLFQNLGAALDLALFPEAVRAGATGGPGAAERRASVNAAIVVGIVAPAAAGLWLVWPFFEAVFVPDAFLGAVAGPAAWLIPALALHAIILYAVSPILQLRHRTGPVLAAAGASVVVAGAILVLRPDLGGAAAMAGVQLASYAAGLAVLVVSVFIVGTPLPWRDFGAALVASAGMTLLLLPWRDMAPGALSLVATACAGIAIYAALAVVLDLAGVRGALGRWWAARR